MVRSKLAALGVSSLLALILAEVSLQLLTRESAFLDPKDDAFWKARASQAIRDRDPVEQQSWEHDPALGWRMKRGYLGRHNSLGFRAHREYALRAAGPRLLALGDSFTYGYGIGEAQTFVSLVGELVDAEVINAGVNGYGVDQALLMWELEGRLHQPDVVILGLFVGDFYRYRLSIRDAGPKPRFVRRTDGSEFQIEGVPVPTLYEYAEKGHLQVPRSSRILAALGWIARGLENRVRVEESRLAPLAEVNRFVISRLRESVEQREARLLVVVIPHHRQRHNPEAQWIADSMRATCQDLDLACCDLTRDWSPDHFLPDGHWNEVGHHLAARRIAAALASDPFASALRDARRRYSSQASDVKGEAE